METQTTKQDPHQWETNAKTIEIGAHTRHYIEILGRLEDTYTELMSLVEATGIVTYSGVDTYTKPTIKSFCTLRNEIRKLMFDHITENLDSINTEL